MKNWTKWILSICLILSLTACGKNNQIEELVDKSTITQSIQREIEPEHILIAYFTWADNTNMVNNNEVDATTSASVTVLGNTAKMAAWIQEYVGGEMFQIVTMDPYSSDYDECLDRAADEKAENVRPELVDHLDNIENYDVIFIGFPNWWSTAPMAVFSFIEEYDFSEKIIVPFCSHGTGGIANSVKDITAILPDSSEVLQPLGIYRDDVEQAQEEIDAWLKDLGFQKNEPLGVVN